MLKVGLTGGIGSGKSTVSRLFADLGVSVIDADVIARQLVQPGQLGLEKLIETFGKEILNVDGSLNRAELRDRAFSDPKIKQKLDAIMHPMIYREIETQLECLTCPYCIIVIPLLLETQKCDMVDRVLVVDSKPAIQIQRVIERDNISEEQVKAIIASQVCRDQRLVQADDIIDNSKPWTNLAEQVKNLHNSYLLLATARITSA